MNSVEAELRNSEPDVRGHLKLLAYRAGTWLAGQSLYQSPAATHRVQNLNPKLDKEPGQDLLAFLFTLTVPQQEALRNIASAEKKQEPNQEPQ